jgi:multiple sugar transport system substrate-binding protein
MTDGLSLIKSKQGPKGPLRKRKEDEKLSSQRSGTIMVQKQYKTRPAFRGLWIAAIFLLTASGLFAGGTQNKDPGKITLSYLRTGTDERSQRAYMDLINEFQTRYPNIVIEYQQYNFGTEMETKLNTLYASGAAPDVVRAPISTIAQRASMGQYGALDSYINNWNERDQIIQHAYNVASYRGKTYGIAINIAASFLLYRKDYFQQAGIDPANPPETWEQLLEYAQKLTIRQGSNVTRAGFSIPVASGNITILPFARQNGSSLIDENNNTAHFNDAATVEALSYLAQFNQKNLLIPFTFNQNQNPFEVGNAAITVGSLDNYNSIVASGVDWVKQIAFAPMVSRKTKSNFGGCQIMFMSEEGKHKNESWEFIKFLFSDSSVWKLVQDAGATPVKKGLFEDFVKLNPEIGVTYLDALNYAEGMPKVEWSVLFEKYINQAYEEAMYGKNAKEALDDALRQLNTEKN